MSDSATAVESRKTLVARADFQYRWRVYAFFIMVFGYGLWSARDGFIKWPADNARNQAIRDQGGRPPGPDYNYASILINRILGVLLPASSLPIFIWLMYRSRGAYRLSDGTLEVPGRPAIPVERIQSLDKSRWERKGVAVVEYEEANGKRATVGLRDMVYERRTTDEIVQRIEKTLSDDGSTPSSPHPSPLPEGEGANAGARPA